MRSMLDIIDDMKDWRVSDWVVDQLLNGKMVRFYRDSECFHVSTGRSGWGQYRIVSLGEILEGKNVNAFKITIDEVKKKIVVGVEDEDDS